MPFTPSSSLIAHQNGASTDIYRWLRSIQPEPFHDLRATYPLAKFPEPGVGAIDQEPLLNGPINPVGKCRKTGRELRLYVLRDHSCAILRAGPEGGPCCEVLPASMSLSTETNDICLKDIPFDDRYKLVPRLRLQSRPDGLRWSFIPGYMKADEDMPTDAEVSNLLTLAMEDTAEKILAEDPIADPRCHDRVPEGARFAPFSVWQTAEEHPDHMARLECAIRSMTQIYLDLNGMSEMGMTLMRTSPDTPWRSSGRANVISTRGRAPNFSHAIADLLDHPKVNIPATLRYGDKDTILIGYNQICRSTSKHEEVAAYLEVSRLYPGVNLKTLFSPKGSTQ